MDSKRMALVVLGVATLIGASSAAAQVPRWVNTDGSGFELELARPDFDDDDDLGFMSAALMLSGRMRLSDKVLLLVDVPLAHGSADLGLRSETSSTLGNPFVGVGVHGTSGWQGTFGVRLPVASEIGEDDFATMIGIFSDVNRTEAFLGKVVSPTAMVGYRFGSASGGWGRVMTGPTAWIPVGDSDVDDPELLLNYGATAGWKGGRVGVEGSWTGRAIVSESDVDFAERTIDMLSARVGATAGKVQPFVEIRLPVDDDYGRYLTSVMVVGLRIGAPLATP